MLLSESYSLASYLRVSSLIGIYFKWSTQQAMTLQTQNTLYVVISSTDTGCSS